MTHLVPLQQNMKVRTSGNLQISVETLKDCDAVGANIFVAMIAKSARGRARTQQQFSIVPPLSKDLAEKLGTLNFEKLLASHGFDSSAAKLPLSFQSTETSIVSADKFKEIDQLVFVRQKSHSNERDSILDEVREQIKDFLQLDSDLRFVHEQIAVVLMEMVKNTVDHSESCASIGLHFSFSPWAARFSFSYCEQGSGIVLNLRHNPNFERKSKAAVSELLHWAFTPGNSSKMGNGVNFGLGMMLMINAARFGDIRLWMWDGDSVVELNQIQATALSHAGLRSNMVPAAHTSLFMYIGEIDSND